MNLKPILSKVIILIGLFTIYSHMSFAQQNIDAILGDWLGQKKDVCFRIYKKNDKYFGKVVWGTGKDSIDTKNPDPRFRNRKLVGAVLLNDFVFDGTDTWQGGTIYDPVEGKTYSCKLTLVTDQKLKVRGYVGIALFGRTDYWTRIKK